MNLFGRCLARGFLGDAEAAVASEHALLLSLIAAVIFATLQGFGQTVYNTLYAVASALPLGS